ncbi:MAG: ABC-F family ATP-binding cassette domain-containing protein [Lachnospiraceae bacterium]|nr:ABC-F family ATP-binding cassette domain-containing protein [Lachnospiraceae bacterium]
MFQIKDLTITHAKDNRMLLSGFSFVLHPGDRVVCIGEEGNGKSTLLKWMADPQMIADYTEATGERIVTGERIGYLPQELPKEDAAKSVYEYFSEEQLLQDANPKELYALLHAVGLAEDFPYSDQQMLTLSGGEKVKAQMTRLLLKEPTMLLLDEPSNDIDIETLEWLERMICETKAGVLYISHDETLIENTATRVIHIEQLKRKQAPKVTVANMPYAQYVTERRDAFTRQTQLALNERREEKKQMERFHRIEQSVEYALRTVGHRNPGAGALLKKKMKAVKSLERRYEREHAEMTEVPEEESPMFFKLGEGAGLPAGKTVLELSLQKLPHVSARDIFLRVRGPEKICIIGKNGAGKTTLLKHIAAELLARKDLHAVYMPQNYDDLLEMDLTPVAYLAPSGDKEEMTRIRTYLGAMKYTADEMSHPIRDLSGGQKAKILLLKMSVSAADVLILDEPTRNFSPLSGPVIRRLLHGFPGAILSVSHDRKYIEEVCDKVYRLTENGLEEVSDSFDCK